MMQRVDYLNGFMYHMSHFENLKNILIEGALLSQQEIDKKGIKTLSIANQEVQSLRKRIYILNFAERRYRRLHSYVPFYFTANTPMLYNQRNIGIHNDLLFFEVSRAYIGTIDHSVLFTDGNASNQQLAKYGDEKVYITPITLTNNSCQRRYMPGGRPLGTNTRRSDFYADEAFLDKLNWDAINGTAFIEDREEYIRSKHAEVLAPDRFPLDEMLSIVVSTNDMKKRVNNLFSELGIVLGKYDLTVVCKPHLFT